LPILESIDSSSTSYCYVQEVLRDSRRLRRRRCLDLHGTAQSLVRWLGNTADTTTLFSRQTGLHEKAGCCTSTNCLPRTIPASSCSPQASGLSIGLKSCEFVSCHVGPGLSGNSMNCIVLSILSDACPSLKCDPLLRELTTCGGFRRSLSSPPSWSNDVSR
jgi:hypothetical protein